MDVIRHGGNNVAQELSGFHLAVLREQRGISELRCAVDGDEQIEFTFLRADFGDVNMEVANRIFCELLLGWFIAIHLRQTADVVTLETAMQA